MCLGEALEVYRRLEAHDLYLRNYPGAVDQTAAEKPYSVGHGTYVPDLRGASKVSFLFYSRRKKTAASWALPQAGLTNTLWSIPCLLSLPGQDQLESRGLAVVCGCGNELTDGSLMTCPHC